MLEEIEHDFEAATKGLEQLKADDLAGINDEEHAARTQKMLEVIEKEFEEATKGLEELRHSTSSTDDESITAKRDHMLDEIEREFEAATSGPFRIMEFLGCLDSSCYFYLGSVAVLCFLVRPLFR